MAGCDKCSSAFAGKRDALETLCAASQHSVPHVHSPAGPETPAPAPLLGLAASKATAPAPAAATENAGRYEYGDKAVTGNDATLLSGSCEMLLPGVPCMVSPCSIYEHVDRGLNDSSSPRSLADCQAGHAADEGLKPHDEPELQAGESSATAARSCTAFDISGLWSQIYSDWEPRCGVLVGFHVGLLLALLVALAITWPSSHITWGGAAPGNNPMWTMSRSSSNTVATLQEALLHSGMPAALLSPWRKLQVLLTEPAAAISRWSFSKDTLNSMQRPLQTAPLPGSRFLESSGLHNPNSPVAAAPNPAVDSLIQEIQQELLLWQAATQAMHAAGLTAHAEQQVRTARSLVEFLQKATAAVASEAKASLKTYPVTGAADAPPLQSVCMQPAVNATISAGTAAAPATAAYNGNGSLQFTLRDPELTSLAGKMPHAAEPACAAGSLEALYGILPDISPAGGPCNRCTSATCQAKCSTGQAGMLACATTAASVRRTPRAGASLASGPATAGPGTLDHPVTFAGKLSLKAQQALQPPHKLHKTFDQASLKKVLVSDSKPTSRLEAFNISHAA